MPTARIRNGELTIPLSDEIQEKLGLRDGDEVEVHAHAGGVIIVRASDEARRDAGLRLLDVIDKVRLRPGQQPLTEAEIAEEVNRFRQARRKLAAHD